MKAVTVGSATIDVIATVASEDIERVTLHNSSTSFLLLEPGRKIDASSVITQTGGGAINAAIAMRRLGFDVATLIKVGADHNAEKISARLTEEGIATDLIRVCQTESTAVSVMIASHDHNAAIFTHRGANGFLAEEDIAPECFAGADLVYITNLSNDSANRFPEIVARAKAAGAFVATNPGIRQLSSKTTTFFDSAREIDFFSCNREEARTLIPALVDRTGWHAQSAIQAISDEAGVLAIEGFRLSLTDYFRRIHDLGPRYAAITCGMRGAYISDNGVLHHQPAIPTKVLGTAGAGDAFTSTLVAGLVRGDGIDRAARMAAHNAASVVAQVDTQSGLMSLKDLQAVSG